MSYKLSFAKLRNERSDELCFDLSEGLEINKACRSWNKMVFPNNYLMTSVPAIKKHIEDAKIIRERQRLY